MAHLRHLPGALGVIYPPVVGMILKTGWSLQVLTSAKLADLAAKTRPVLLTKQIPTLRRYSWRVLNADGSEGSSAAAVRCLSDAQARRRLPAVAACCLTCRQGCRRTPPAENAAGRIVRV